MTEVGERSPVAVDLRDPSPPFGSVVPAEDTSSRRRPARIHGLTVAVALISIILILTAAILARSVHHHTEDRLLRTQGEQAAAVLTAAVGGVTGLLVGPAELAATSGGDAATFESVLGGAVESQQFISASLWDSAAPAAPVVVLGEQPEILSSPELVASMLDGARTPGVLSVTGIVGDPSRPKLGYGLGSQGTDQQYVVYIESLLPSPRRGAQRGEDAFVDLDYALYVDDSESDEALLFSSVEDLPIDGRRAAAPVPFGNKNLLLVVKPIGSLSGGLSRTLPWVVALVGLPLSLGFSGLVERLLRRRDAAVETSKALAMLSDENAHLYAEQRGIAETLQRSLLPDHLPTVSGASVAARYWPAGTASEVGGDFYDVFELGDGRWGLAIGDVCGKGVSAAALTGVARHTIQAAARHVDTPAEVLRWVHDALRSKGTTMFCTVCFGVLTIRDDRPVSLELALGGHPPPLLCRADGTSEEIGSVGTVLGIIEPTLTNRTYELRSGDVVLFFTDGLTDAPQGTAVTMQEVEALHASDPRRSPDATADEIQRLIESRRPLGSGDDTALLIVRIS